MKNKTNINEQDIFKYVFSPQSLSEEKIKSLRGSKKYEKRILYYESVKNAIDSETPVDLKKKIAAKIPKYTLANVFTLHPVKYEENKERNGPVIFAAKTKEEQAKLKTYTFTDDDRKFLIRIISVEDSTKLYLFSISGDTIKDITLKILPGGEEFFMNNNSTPLMIDKIIEVGYIELSVGDG